MAKRKAGLPDDFDLKVSRADLVDGPARLPGYLERTGMRLPPLEEEPIPTQEIAEPTPTPPPSQGARLVQFHVEPKSETVAAAKVSEERVRKPKGPRKQINLTEDALLMVEDIVGQIIEQSPEKSVNFNDVIQGLIIKLHESRDYIDVSQLPLRGRWGSPTAKSFSAALAAIFGDAIKKNDSKSDVLYKQVVGS